MFRRLLFAAAAAVAFAGVSVAQPGYAAPNTFAPPPPGALNGAAPAPLLPDGGGLLPGDPQPPVWSGGGEIGLNGAEGNSKLFSIRTGLNAKRTTDTNILTTDFLYTYAKQQSILTQNQMLFNARDEVLFPGSRWSLFGSTNIEYDQLRAYDFLIGLYGGVGYEIAKNEVIDWRARAGVGAVRLVGGPDDRWVPELVLGTDFSYKIDDRQSLVANIDYYPRIDNFSQYRLRARVAYQIVLDKEHGVTLRFGLQDRFDSNPGPGVKQNDLTYFTTLGFTF